MAGNSNIEWTDATWNPIAGCDPVSPGCLHCYAATMANRLEAMGQEKYAGLTVKRNGVRTFNGTIHLGSDEDLAIPLNWKKPRMVFANSMSDLFHKDVPFEFVDKVFAVMALCPQHAFQILTKRPERMAEYLNSKARADGVSKTNCLDTGFMVAMQMENYCGGKPFGFEETDPKYWPLPNVWLGTSVENQKCADERIPHLLKCPAAIRFLSIEPLLGPVELRLRSDGVPMNQWGFPLGPCGYYCDESVGHVDHGSNSIHWAIVGCESGPGHRFMADEWASRIREQCHRAEVPFFMKQMEINGKVTTDIEKFPPHLRVREFPKVLNRQDAKVAKSL